MSWFGKKEFDEKKPNPPVIISTNPSMQVRVDSAYPSDQGGGKVRVDPLMMLSLKVTPGDLIAIEGKRRTIARVWRALVEDWNQQKIRIDNFTQQNADVSIGDTVSVAWITNEIEATRAVLAPPEDLPKKIPIANNPTVVNGLIDFPVVKNDIVPITLGLPFIQPQIIGFKVVEIEPLEAFIITKNTIIEFCDDPEINVDSIRRLHYEDIGGLKDQIQQIRDIVELTLFHPEISEKMGLEFPKGLLIFGPSGTGKTLVGKVVASECNVHFICITGPEIVSQYQGESEQRLREVFEEARENAPSIIFIDEIESITPHIMGASEVGNRVVATLLSMMDGLEERGKVIVIGTARRIDIIEPAVMRSGRFDRVIEFCLPNESDREEILKIHSHNLPLSKDISLKDIAQKTYGYSGADLALLCKEAALYAVKRSLPESGITDLATDEISLKILNSISVAFCDFQNALKKINSKIVK